MMVSSPPLLLAIFLLVSLEDGDAFLPSPATVVPASHCSAMFEARMTATTEENFMMMDEQQNDGDEKDLVRSVIEETPSMTPGEQTSALTTPSATTMTMTSVIGEKVLDIKSQLEKQSRPKRFTISTHSAFSSIVTAFFFAAIVPHLSPGLHANGLPRVYDMVDFDNWILAKSTGLMFAVSAVTGVLRLPPRSTKLRRLMFESCAWATVLLYCLQDSNIFMIDGGYSLDVFDGPGWFITFVVFVGTVISTLEYLVEGIAGPDEGRDCLPFGGNRLGMAFVSTFAYLGISPMSLTIPPWFFDHNRQAFDDIVLPGLHMVTGWNLSVNFIIEAYMGFGMLISTLLYENKLTQNQAAALLLVNFFITGAYDQFAVLIPSASMPAELAVIGEYARSITTSMPLNELFGSLWFVSLAKAMVELNEMQRQRGRGGDQDSEGRKSIPVFVPLVESDNAESKGL